MWMRILPEIALLGSVHTGILVRVSYNVRILVIIHNELRIYVVRRNKVRNSRNIINGK